MRTGTLLLTVIPLVATAIVIRLGVREHLPSSPGFARKAVQGQRTGTSTSTVIVGPAVVDLSQAVVSSPFAQDSGVIPPGQFKSSTIEIARIIASRSPITPPPTTPTYSELIGKVEQHPAFRGWLGSDASDGYIRDAALHGGWDRPVMLRQAHASPSPAPTQPVILNDWSPQKHGPSSPPGDLQHGHGNHLPGFPGVFDRDLQYRHDVDRAPLVPLSGNSPPPQR